MNGYHPSAHVKIHRWNTRGISLLTTLLAALLAGCCHVSEKPKPDLPVSPNQAILDEINRSGAWFHAKKTRPIWVRKLDQDQTVDTLEGSLTARAGDYLCRGEAGEVWPQTAKNVEAKYTATEVMDAAGWRRYDPHPDAEGVMAAQVPHSFQVQATWGLLSGKAGDYIAKNFRDREAAYPDDVWIVDQTLFRATYQAAGP